ncbi:hypothetical protein BRD04_01840 [Halobacteriales archaeon QS_9_67_17]|nr:MAG: hypothetical protein BRD04_01840 [Halobacteriales archaeon QS_9_67_17]
MSWVSPDGSAEGLGEALDTRGPLLTALAAGVGTKRELRDELGVARSTVYKGLRELTTLGLVRETADGYALTASGRLAEQMHTTYRERLELLADAQSVLASLPADAGVPPAFLEDATVATADRHAPERPLTVFESLADEAKDIRSLSPAAVPRFMSDLHESVAAGAHRGIVVERPAAEALAAEYDGFDEALASGLAMYAIDEPLPFGLTVFDDEGAALTTYDDGGVSGLLHSTADGAVAWARGTYESYRERGERL